jgi:hypothetical protein
MTDKASEAKTPDVEMPLNESAGNNLSGHRRVLGVCWLIYGIFRLIMGICLVLFSGTATVMFGALLDRVRNPFALMSDFHIVYAGVVVLAFLCGLLGVLAGVALLANQRPARTLALVAAFLSVSEIPFGTTLGIYTLIVLLPLRGVSPVIRSQESAR